MESPQTLLRESYLSKKPPRNGWPLTALSLSTMGIVSLMYWNLPPGALFSLTASPEEIFRKYEYWRLLTTIAVHLNPEHFFSNALFFGVLSYLLYSYFGPFLFPFCALFAGSLTNLIALATYREGTELMGASGVVYWMSGFWLILYFQIDRRYSVTSRLLRCLGFALVTLIPETYKPQVSYRTHAVGFILGLLFGAFYFLFKRDFFQKAEVWHDAEESFTDDTPITGPR